MSGHAYSAAALPEPAPRVPRERSGTARALAVAGGCTLALVLLWVIANLVPQVQFRDAVALREFTLLGGPRVDRVGNFLLRLLEPHLFVIWGAVLVAIALARGRVRTALAVCAVLGLAPLTAEKLKPLLAHPHASAGVHIGAASWPSGHATAAMAFVLCAVLVAPRRLRPFVAVLGGAYALAVGGALLILAWHMPSDVAGGFLIAALWTALAVAALRAAERRWPRRA
jgi:membrane-associated phospholipid phosphatase